MLFVIAQDLRKMRVLADVDEADVGKLAEKMDAECVVDAFPGETFHGIVSQVRYSPNNVSGVVTYSAVVEVDNPEEKLRPGMTATVTIRTHEAQGVPRIPNAALRFKPTPPDGPDGKPIPQPPEPPLEKGKGRVYVLTSDKPGDEKDEIARRPIGITDGIFTEVDRPARCRSATKVVTDENETRQDKKKKGLMAAAVSLPAPAARRAAHRAVARLEGLRHRRRRRARAARRRPRRSSNGEFVAIVGTSGSGKSTMMNILGCLDRPTRGTYTLAGIDVGDARGDARAIVRNRLIGFIFQGFNLLPRTTALENCELPLQYRGVGARERKRRARRRSQAVGLGDRMHHTPNQLSGGQQQRVAIARALVTDPPLLLADEPTGNLDTRTSLEVLALLQQLNRERGITIVLVTHEPDIAACASRVITMRDGRIVSDVVQDAAARRGRRARALPAAETRAGPCRRSRPTSGGRPGVGRACPSASS